MIVFTATTSKKDNPIIKNWLKGNYETVVIYYDSDEKKEVIQDGITYVYNKGFKYPMIKEYLLKHGLKHEQYLFIDDDVLISSDEIKKLFEYAEKYKLQFYHPAINPKNYDHDPSACKMMYRNKDWKLSRQDWTEISCIGMNRKTLEIVLSTFDTNNSGYGLPQIWQSYFQEPCFNVVHDIEVIMTRPLGATGSLSDVYGMELLAKEFHEAMKLVPKRDYKGVVQVIAHKPLLSVFVIYRPEDENYLKECLDSIPNYAQKVVVRTLELDYAQLDENGYLPKPYELILTGKSEMSITADLYFQDPDGIVDFDKAKNKAKELCNGYWCFNLDADERIILNQWSEIYQMLENAPNSAGGFYVTQNNIMLHIQDTNTKVGVRNPAAICRIFRNDERIKYFGEIHETVEESIESFAKIGDSNIQILHLGFQRDAKVLIEKCERNLRKLWRNPHLMKLKRYMDYLTNTTMFRNELIEKTKGN